MLTKLPDCPRCLEDELWRVPGKDLRVRCYLCGWDSGPLIVADGESVAQRIERAVLEARAQRERRGNA